MAISAGYPTGVWIATTYGGSYNAIDGANSFSFNRSAEQLETTEFEDSQKNRIYGLFDGGANISGDYDYSNTAQSDLYTQFKARTGVFLRVYWNGSAGHIAYMMVESFDLSSEVGGKTTFTCNLSLAIDPNGNISSDTGVDTAP